MEFSLFSCLTRILLDLVSMNIERERSVKYHILNPPLMMAIMSILRKLLIQNLDHCASWRTIWCVVTHVSRVLDLAVMLVVRHDAQYDASWRTCVMTHKLVRHDAILTDWSAQNYTRVRNDGPYGASWRTVLFLSDLHNLIMHPIVLTNAYVHLPSFVQSTSWSVTVFPSVSHSVQDPTKESTSIHLMYT